MDTIPQDLIWLKKEYKWGKKRGCCLKFGTIFFFHLLFWSKSGGKKDDRLMWKKVKMKIRIKRSDRLWQKKGETQGMIFFAKGTCERWGSKVKKKKLVSHWWFWAPSANSANAHFTCKKRIMRASLRKGDKQGKEVKKGGQWLGKWVYLKNKTWNKKWQKGKKRSKLKINKRGNKKFKGKWI